MKRARIALLLFLGLLLLGSLVVGLAGCTGGGQARISNDSASPPPTTTLDVEGLVATVFLSPTCGCCHGYVEHLRRQGLQVKVVEMMDVSPKKRAFNIPMEMWSCHTTVIGNYVIEGHVPFEIVEKLLVEKPDIDGIALPGMPTGVPGMPGPKEPLTIYALTDGQAEVYMQF